MCKHIRTMHVQMCLALPDFVMPENAKHRTFFAEALPIAVLHTFYRTFQCSDTREIGHFSAEILSWLGTNTALHEMIAAIIPVRCRTLTYNISKISDYAGCVLFVCGPYITDVCFCSLLSFYFYFWLCLLFVFNGFSYCFLLLFLDISCFYVLFLVIP